MIPEIIKILKERGFIYAPNERGRLLRGEYRYTVSEKQLFGRNVNIIKASYFTSDSKYADYYYIVYKKHEDFLHLENNPKNIKYLADLFYNKNRERTKN